MRRVLLAALMALACADPASAQRAEPSAVDLASCVAWTAELESALARATEDEARRPWLGPAQDAWSAWRDAECAYRASLALGGSMARVLSAACLADLTAARAIDFIHAERSEE
jgi:uncharacterized protein YecT (DUF1311 family)